MICLTVTATRRPHCIFVPSVVKINPQQCISNIVEVELLPWVNEYFQESLWSFQQDPAPSHSIKQTQQLIQKSISSKARMYGLQKTPILTYWIFLFGSFWSRGFQAFFMLLSMLWMQNCTRNKLWFQKSSILCVKHSHLDLRLWFQIEVVVILNKCGCDMIVSFTIELQCLNPKHNDVLLWKNWTVICFLVWSILLKDHFAVFAEVWFWLVKS